MLACDLLDPAMTARIEDAVSAADIGVCAADNEEAKYRFDALMRRFGKPWTLGEVLAGGIGGFVHRFTPGGPCYGCVASHLQRSVTVDRPKAPSSMPSPSSAFMLASSRSAAGRLCQPTAAIRSGELPMM